MAGLSTASDLLVLNGGAIDADALRAALLSNRSSLKMIEITSASLGDDGVRTLLSLLQSNTSHATLRYLSLANNGIGDAGGCALAEWLKGTQLQQLVRPSR